MGAHQGLGAYQAIVGWMTGLGVPDWLAGILYRVGAGLLMMVFISVVVLWLIYMLRKEMGHMQLRMGPNVTGPLGLFQTVADAIKILTKEDIIPAAADRPIFMLAPFVVFFSTGMLYMVLPLAPTWIINNVNVGLLFFVAFGSLTAFGIMMAGWGSNNKYSLVGGMRSVAQIVSYEVPMVLSLLGVAMLAGTLSTGGIVGAQRHVWFILLQPLGFLIYFLCGLAETNQTPFDLPEGESELVSGFNTEYSGMRFALFYLAEFANSFAISAMITTLFLGGWHGPVLPFLPWLWPFIWFMVKTLLVVFVMYWIRSTWLRLRIDQVMSLTWKVLVPLALLNVFISVGEMAIVRVIGG
ncbi:MAG: NADH-quinone oxidoreductase subunit NuoH [Firmicutes bacterium]|nr:NADH-quinone oxidoreductase subunit NuoH [Bacillota bacterium]